MLAGLLAVIQSAFNWRWLVIGVSVLAAGLGLWGYVGHLKARAATAEASVVRLSDNLAATITAADANAAALEAAKLQAAEHIAALERDRAALAARIARDRTIQREIDHAPPADDGPVAPVLSRTLDRMRGGSTTAPGSDENKAGTD